MARARWGLGLQAIFYVAAGINHFWHPGTYRQIMPAHYSHPEAMVAASGIAEMAGGAGLLLPATRRVAAVGIIAMLVVFLDVHQDMLRHGDRFAGIPRWALWARLPLQAVLIAWAFRYARREKGPVVAQG
jgi:uncharacterized membrane protein